MERQAPIRMTEFAGCVRQFDFGKDAFGWLEVKKSEEGGEKREEGLVIRLGESVTADGRIDMCPGGTIRACAVTCSVEKTGWVRIPLTADRRNTCGMNEETSKQVVKLPEATGVIMPFRYAEVEGGGKSGEVDVRRVWLHWPIDEGASSFSSSSPALDKVYDFCKYSIVATSFAGVYVDGDRERIPYEADGYINQLCHYAIDCDFAMARATYRRLLKFPTWPTEWKQHMIMMAWTDWMWSGSIELAKESYDTLKNEKLLLDLAREDGLVVSGGTRYPKMFNGNDIVDWPPGERDGFEVGPVNAVVNAFHYLNLVQMSEIAQALGKSEDARFFRERAAKVKTAFNRVFTDGKTWLYLDGEGARHSSAHANIAALAFGLVPDERVGAVADFIERKGMVCSVYFAQYLLEALFKAGRAEAAIRLMTADGDRSWLGMMESGSTITMEAWNLTAKPNQDWNHAWATAPLNIIARYVLGVTPAEPGFTKVRVRPQPGGLKRVCGTVPIPGGAVKVTIEDGKLTVDSTSEAVIEWKKDDIVFDVPDSHVEFGGVGFQNAEANLVSLMTDEFRDERVLKSFREISPTFARVYAGFADCPKSQMDRFADYYDLTFRRAGTELYAVAGMMPFVSDDAVGEYAEKVAKNLEYLVRGRGLSGIRYYCLTNELGINGRGGWFYSRMDSFRRFFAALHSAFQRHGLDIALVATDVNAHVKDSLKQLDWAVRNMDDLVGGYCTHWYMFLGNGLVPSSLQNAVTMADHFAPLVAKAAEKGKRYFVGEIGVWTPPTSGGKVMHDDTGYPLRAPQFANEGAITLAEIALAAMNAGAYGALSWSFADHPDPFVIEDGDTPSERAVYESARCVYWPDWKYNKWGVFRWDSVDRDYTAYPSLYTMGYMAKLFRRGSRVLKRTVNDGDVRAGGVVNRDGSLSLAVINWGAERDLGILVPEGLARKPMRIYGYDSANPPLNDFNDLQSSKGLVSANRGRLRLRVPAKSMTFLTTDYQDAEPAKVEGVKIVNGTLVWDAVKGANHCYYRVYVNGRQIASTVATHCEKPVSDADEVKVCSVDRWGNQGG